MKTEDKIKAFIVLIIIVVFVVCSLIYIIHQRSPTTAPYDEDAIYVPANYSIVEEVQTDAITSEEIVCQRVENEKR